jgi:predicted kinase
VTACWQQQPHDGPNPIARQECRESASRLLRIAGAPRIIGCMDERRLYLVCGLPGAGKTTRSRLIRESVGAVHLCADEWVIGLGISLVDYDFRVKLQDCMLLQASAILRAGVSTIIEFGSWHRQERERIRQAGAAAGAAVELHFLDAPLENLVHRVRARGGPEAENLVAVLVNDSAKFEYPSAEEAAVFDRYVGPNDDWKPASDHAVAPPSS